MFNSLVSSGRLTILFATAVFLLQAVNSHAQESLLLDLEIAFPNGRDAVEMTATELDELTQYTVNTHSPYYEGSMEFSGPLLVDVLKKSAGRNLETNTRISLHALNNYFVHTTLGELKRVDALLATRKAGSRMSIRERGPYWIILPLTDRPELDSETFHKLMVWQLHKINVGG